jgi:hypothetical protein
MCVPGLQARFKGFGWGCCPVGLLDFQSFLRNFKAGFFLLKCDRKKKS